MSRMARPDTVRFVAVVLAMSLGMTACAPASPNPPFTANGQENMPIFASIWVTSEPAVPTVPVDVRLTQADSPGFERAHTFVAGAALRGSIPLSTGRYHIEGLDGACALDVFAGPERETDVLLHLEDGGGCVLTVAGEHGLGDGSTVDHDEPSILMAPGSQ